MSESSSDDPLELVPSEPSAHKPAGEVLDDGGYKPPPPPPPGTPPPPPPPDPDKPETKPDDRTFGLVSHLSLLVCCVGPIAIYYSKGKQSKFIKFHALQATFFMLFSLVCMMPMIATTTYAIWRSLDSGRGIGEVIPHVGLDSCVSLFFTGYSIYVGYRAYKGYLTEYLVLGAIARRMVYGEEENKE